MRFQLGQKVRCNITEMEGKVSQISKHIYSQDRYCIQPPYNKEKAQMPSAHFIDDASLEAVEGGQSTLATIHQYRDGDICLGDVVKDTLTGMEGKVTERSLCLNGCYRLRITYMGAGDNAKHAYHTWVEEKGVEVVKKIAETDTKPEQRSTGSVMEEVSWN